MQIISDIFWYPRSQPNKKKHKASIASQKAELAYPDGFLFSCCVAAFSGSPFQNNHASRLRAPKHVKLLYLSCIRFWSMGVRYRIDGSKVNYLYHQIANRFLIIMDHAETLIYIKTINKKTQQEIAHLPSMDRLSWSWWLENVQSILST